MRIGRTRIKAAQFELWTQNVTDQFQYARHRNQPLKDVALIHQVCKPPRLRFLAKFCSGVFAFPLVELFYFIAGLFEHGSVQKFLDDHIAGGVQLFAFRSSHDIRSSTLREGTRSNLVSTASATLLSRSAKSRWGS